MAVRIRNLIFAGCAFLLSACTTEELNYFADSLAAGVEESFGPGYGSGYNAGHNTGYNSGYSGPYYDPYGFSSYSGWSSGYSYGDYVGYRECRNTGSYYTCDSDGDGYADMYGDTDDGSYASSNLRVNGRGEAYTWDSSCSCWEREYSLDGSRTDYHDDYDDY